MTTAVLRPDRYLCPADGCPRWCGEHLRSGLLARHGAPGGSRYDLCTGSLKPIRGLVRQAGADPTGLPPSSPYTQPYLF